MKNLEQIVAAIYLHLSLFRMHESYSYKDEIEFLKQIVIEHVLAQKPKGSDTGTAQVTNINEYQEIILEEYLRQDFLSVIKQISAEFSLQSFKYS